MAKVGCVGLGTMGGPIAGHLLEAGHEVAVWNRTAAKADEVPVGRRIGDAVAERLGVPAERVFQNIERYGNTTAASIPIALTEAVVFYGFVGGLLGYVLV